MDLFCNNNVYQFYSWLLDLLKIISKLWVFVFFFFFFQKLLAIVKALHLKKFQFVYIPSQNCGSVVFCVRV